MNSTRVGHPLRHFAAVVSCLVLCGGFGTAAADTLLGVTPYSAFAADSPFAAMQNQFAYFYLENFEDGALNTPGVTATTGGIVRPDGKETDSVDEDDGLIDGRGSKGWSFYSSGQTTQLTFAFDADVLGNLPNHVGIVWTDVGSPVNGIGELTFMAFDADGNLVGMIGPEIVGDGFTDGLTAEDRFVGIISDIGIASIVVDMGISNDFEVDHLQYGFMAPVPVPPALALFAGALAALGIRARKR